MTKDKRDISLIIRTILLCLSIFVQSFAIARQNDPPMKTDQMLEEWRYTEFPELTGRNIRDISSEEEANKIWFALDSGVMSYDGYQFTSYGKKEGITDLPVQKIYCKASGTVFIISSKTVYTYLNGTWQIVFQLPDPITWTVYNQKHLKDGTLAIASDQGLLLIRENKSLLLTTQNQQSTYANIPSLDVITLPEHLLPDGKFHSFSDMVQTSDQTIWLGITYQQDEPGDILELNLQNLYNGKTNPREIGKRYQVEFGSELSFLKTANGQIWVIDKLNKHKPQYFYDEEWKTVPFGSRFGDDEYGEQIISTDNGDIWVSSIGNLYRRTPDGDLKKYNYQNAGIPQTHIRMHQNGSDLWIYGDRSDVTKIDLSEKKWLTYQGINYMGRDTEGKDWYLRYDGTVISNFKDNWRFHQNEVDQIDHPVQLFIDGAIIWAVGSDNGKASASYFDGRDWQKFTFDSLSWSIDYRAVFKSADGAVWLGGCTDILTEKGQTGGIAEIRNPYGEDPQIKYHRSRQNGYEQLGVYGLKESADGIVWAGGRNLLYFEKGNWHRHPNREFHEFVTTLHTDNDGKLYVGTRKHGLYIRESSGDWQAHHLDNGLKSNTIISITTASDDKLWLATSKEISLYQQGLWTNNVLPKALNLSNEGGELITDPENALRINYSSREWKRRTYNENHDSEQLRANFRTVRFIRDTIAPQTRITYYNPRVESDGNTFVRWDARSYFNKTSPGDFKYSYRLNKGKWSDLTARTSRTFTGLKSGNYTFEVKAIDKEGNIDRSPALIVFEVKPLVWLEPWFISLVILVLIILVYFQVQLIRKRQKLLIINRSLESVNQKLEAKNAEVATQNEHLSETYRKIEELSNAKMKFFTNITHEFKTPLSLILGPLDKLIRESRFDDQQQKLHEIIYRNAFRLQKLINQLLEVRRVESGHLDLRLQEDDIVVFTRSTLSFFYKQAMQKDVNIRFHSETEQLIMCFDQDKVEKILINILSNAIKYSHPGGNILVQVKGEKDDPVLKCQVVEITVQDWGLGMDEVTLSGLFDRFAIGTAGNQSVSTGIGMSYVKELINLHNGRVAAKSKLGEGTTIRAVLPANLIAEVPGENWNEESIFAINGDPESRENDVIRAQIKFDKKPVILVVEDNEDMNYFICNSLTDQFEVLSAFDGAEGLGILENNYVDLVISDVMMPVLDGLSLCRKIRENPAISHLPVIILSANSNDDKVLAGYKLGADSYLTKPFNADILLVRVVNLLWSREKMKESLRENPGIVPKQLDVSSYDEEFIAKISRLLEENVSNAGLDMEWLAEQTNLSYSQFSRKIKQLTGRKPRELLLNFRMKRAAQLLKMNKIPISQVGYNVGYDVPNSFSRAFRAEFGMSPRQFAGQHHQMTGSE